MNARTIIIAIALLVTAADARAQDRTLERVQNLIATGRLSEARSTLAQWETEHDSPDTATNSDDRAHALYLSGLLSTDTKAADDAFLGVVLGYPSSPIAPEALLRLGQNLYDAGETERAIDYLERLRYDYPRSSQRETGMLWLARAQLAAGNAAAACGTAREGLLSSANQNVRTLTEIERDRACEMSGGLADGPPPPVQNRLPDLGIAVDTAPGMPVRIDPPPAVPDPVPVRREEPPIDPRTDVRTDPPVDPRSAAPPARADDAARTDVPPTTTTSSTATGPEYAVQTAAFAQRRSAETIVSELHAKGFEARIVTVPGSPYFRVRYGAFMTRGEAAAAALSIRDAGFATLVVNDVRLERQP